jgi:hypothetical protein
MGLVVEQRPKGFRLLKKKEHYDLQKAVYLRFIHSSSARPQDQTDDPIVHIQVEDEAGAKEQPAPTVEGTAALRRETAPEEAIEELGHVAPYLASCRTAAIMSQAKKHPTALG